MYNIDMFDLRGIVYCKGHFYLKNTTHFCIFLTCFGRIFLPQETDWLLFSENFLATLIVSFYYYYFNRREVCDGILNVELLKRNEPVEIRISD